MQNIRITAPISAKVVGGSARFAPLVQMKKFYPTDVRLAPESRAGRTAASRAM